MTLDARSVSQRLLPFLLVVVSPFVNQAQPLVTYISGPAGCIPATGYIDYPFCTINSEVPLGSFVPPAIGHSYVDANFGGTVTALSNAGWVHSGSFPTPLSANNTHLLEKQLSSGTAQVLDPVTGQVLFKGIPYSTALTVWDSYSDDVYYYISGAQVHKYVLSTATDTVLVDYSGPGYGFTSITSGGYSDSSSDNWIAFWAPSQTQVCALDLTNIKTYCANYMAPAAANRVGWNWISAVLITKGVDSVTSARSVLLVGSPALGMWSVNTGTGRLDFQIRGPENPEGAGNHNNICDSGEDCLTGAGADLMQDYDGRQYLVGVKGYSTPCGLELVTMALSTGQLLYVPTSLGGGRNGVMMLAACGQTWPFVQIGCAKSAAYCAVSTYRGALRNPTDVSTPFPSEPHRDEILVMQGNGQAINTLSISRSVVFTNDWYWAQPRAAISPDGSLVAYDSNFGVPFYERVNAVSTNTTKLTVTISPTSGSLAAGEAKQFSAVIHGGLSALTWSINPKVGTIDASGLYSAPALISTAQTVTVTASSTSYYGVSGSATVNLKPISVTISPTTATLKASQTQQFSATVANGAAGVTWSLNPAVGTVSATGLYTAPSLISTTQTVTITATSTANGTKTASAVITLQPTVSVSVTPGSASLSASQTQQFTATVTNGAAGVTWSVSPEIGTLSTAGLYTAPSLISTTQTVTITAASTADPTKSASASITLQPISVTVTPASVALGASQTQQFTATVANGAAGVTWAVNPAVGTISTTGLYTAPALISLAQSVTVTATSTADSTKSASASISLLAPVSISVTPPSATIATGQTQQFTATVANGAPGATWSVSPSVGSISTSGLYTAPASLPGALSQIVIQFTPGAADFPILNGLSVTAAPGSTGSFTPVYINAGAGGTHTDANGITWVADMDNSGGDTCWTGYTIANTIDSLLYDTCRRGVGSYGPLYSSFTYTIPVPTGSYIVTLKFAELFMTGPGQRQFNVSINGAPVLTNFDIFAHAGGAQTAFDQSFPVNILNSQAVTVTATSTADPTKSISASITVQPPVAVTLTPNAATLGPAQTQQFTASVANGAPGVTWSLNPAVGTISASGLYTAPASISTTQSITITATSVADPTKSVSVSVSLQPPVSVSVTPGSVTLSGSQTQQFTATVLNGAPTVTWSLSPTMGTLSASGVYTAPTSISAAQAVTVTATSTTDPTKSVAVLVNLQPPVSVTLTPGSVTLGAAQSQQFSATISNGSPGVTWSITPLVGAISLAGLYTAPATISSAQTVTVTATSTADSTKSGSATVSLQPQVGGSGIANLAVIGTTPTQAILSYLAPNTNFCTVEVSESSSYSPLVNDVNGAFFSGANLDSRPGNLVSGMARIVVIGKRSADLALNGRQYSRSLQNNTTHYVRVTCGTSVATTSFTTANLPYGNTYPDVSTSVLTSPGTYNWPTIDASTGRTTDPQTGVAMWPFGFGYGWTSGARTIMCSQFPTTDNGNPAKSGYPCMPSAGGDLFWLDTTDGIVRDIGKPMFTWCSQCYAGDTVDTQVVSVSNMVYTASGNFLATTITDPQNKTIVMSAPYTGHWQAGDLGTLNWTNLTPASQGKDLLSLMQGFDSSFNPAMVSYVTQVGLTGDQTKAVIYAEYGVQNSIGYIAVFDPAASGTSAACAPGGCVVAMMASYKAPPTRWSGFHSENAVEGSGSWITFEPSNTSYNNGWPMDSGGNNNGDGPYIVTTTSALTSSPQYAAGTAIPGFSGVVCPAGSAGCDILAVSGPPCDPTPGAGEPRNCPWNSGYYYMMNAAVGDYVQPADNTCGAACEAMQILAINGNSWVLQRGVFNGLQNHAAITTYGMVCGCNFNSDSVGWNFVSDAMGSGSGLIVDTTNPIDHGTYSNLAAAGDGYWFNCAAAGEVLCVDIKPGTNPAMFLNQPAAAQVNTAPAFAGVTGITVGNVVETYTSGPPVNPAVANGKFVVHTKPVEVGPFNTYTPVTGNLYQVTITNGYGNYDAKASVALAVCNGQPMLNVSSAATGNVIATDNTASYEYCYAKNANECRSGSSPGQFYVNCPNYNGDSSQNYVIASSPLVAKFSQLRWDDPNAVGRDTRPLTSGFRPFQHFTSYSSGRALPSGDTVLVYSDQVPGGQSAINMVHVPPTTPWDGVDRTTWVPVSVSAVGKAGATAVVNFGYAENGAPNAFYCTSRQEVCQATGNTIGSPAYYFASENPNGQACSTGGCSFKIPGISGRVMYYQVTYSDGSVDPMSVIYVR